MRAESDPATAAGRQVCEKEIARKLCVVPERVLWGPAKIAFPLTLKAQALITAHRVDQRNYAINASPVNA